MIQYSWLIPIFPLVGFLINGVGYKVLPKIVTSSIGSLVIFLSFIISVGVFIDFQSGASAQTFYFFDFINAGSVNIQFSFLVDQLTSIMLLIITGIGFLIHLYSAGYMHDDDGFGKFFAYLNLFVFFMLLLVLGANYVMMFIGWEGVGLCSYLLIGFWFKNNEYNDAAKKAFIMNRIGDLGFLLAMFLIMFTFDSLDFGCVMAQASTLPIDTIGTGVITVITLLLFVGAMGKSAQLPLYTWLPDAMAGPTPVSALIHAATMVTAGIYMIARSNVLFTLAPVTLSIIAIIGVATALFAATIGLVQNDIKKVLAYSTVSQLGYMFLGLGVGSYVGGMFHVLTHAFFKALLFLGAGSVIHAMSGEQDIRNMGGLAKKLPITFITFLLGTIAIAGIPPFAGFFSKDLILAEAFVKNPILWGAGVLGALMTSFYMFRLLFLTFFGKFRGTEHQKSHLHESPLTMTIPLIILSILSVVGGFVNVPAVLGGGDWLQHFLDPIFMVSNQIKSNGAHHLSHETEYVLMAISVGVAVIGIIIAYIMYMVKDSVAKPDSEITGLHKVVYNKYYIDEIYNLAIRKPLDNLSDAFYSIVDRLVIDNIVNLFSSLTSMFSQLLRKLQVGTIGSYIFMMVLGLIAIFAATLFI